MWHDLLERLGLQVPIGSVTNGVHLPTWMAPPMRELFDQHLGEDWETRAADPQTWAGVDGHPRRGAVGGPGRAPRRAGRLPAGPDGARPAGARRADRTRREAAAQALRPARAHDRVRPARAAYKRIYLLIADPDRAFPLLCGRPAGPAGAGRQGAPAGRGVQAPAPERAELQADPRVGERVAFVEDYDMRVARAPGAGVRVWLNLPRQPLEASGTSGMKAALNGGLNLSVLDGWWAEAYGRAMRATVPNGWAIEPDPSLSPRSRTWRDATALYDLLENEVVPLWNERDQRGIPVGWVARMKRSLMTIGPAYCATRMMDDYLGTMYHAAS